MSDQGLALGEVRVIRFPSDVPDEMVEEAQLFVVILVSWSITSTVAMGNLRARRKEGS